MEPGNLAPDFELPDEQGGTWTLGGLLADGPVVLFFYPAAMSAGCTVQSCHFRDLARDFAALGARRVGISSDSVERQRAFAERHSFGFPLLSDGNGVVAGRFKVRRGLGATPTRRRTFVIGRDRRIVDVIRSEVRMREHADRALEVLRRHVV